MDEYNLHLCDPAIHTPPELDPGIRRTVAWIRSMGFFTADSGDGTSKGDDEREFDVPHVVVMCEASELIDTVDRLVARVSDLGIDRQDVTVQGNYSGALGLGWGEHKIATVLVLGVSDSDMDYSNLDC